MAAMSTDPDAESPLTSVGTQLLLPSTLREQLKQPAVVFAGEGPAWQFLLWIAVPLLLANFLLGPLGCAVGPGGIDSDVYKVLVGTVFAICLGMIPLQFVILNCYAVFSAERWWLRLIVLLGYAIVYSGAAILGFTLLYFVFHWGINETEVDNVLEILCILPTIVLASQLPFWFLRIFLGWQFVRVVAEADDCDADCEQVAVSQPLSILHLLVATAVVATSLGLIRIAPQTTGEEEKWTALGAISGIAFVVSLLSLIFLFLFARIRSRLLYWVLAVGVPLLIVATVWAVIAIFWGEFFINEFENLSFATLIFSTIGLTFIVGLTNSLWLLRCHGWTIGSPRA